MTKRWFILLAKMLLALIVLLIAFLLFERIRGQVALANYRKALIAKGERLSPKDFVRQFSESENGAPKVIEAIQRLQRGTVLPDNPPPRMRLTPSGRAIVGFREPMWVGQGAYRNGEWKDEVMTNLWEQLGADLTANQATLGEIRKQLAKPVLNNQVDLGQGMKMKFLHLTHPKSLASWLGSASSLALHDGNNREALVYLLMQIQLPRILEEDCLVISELVRIAIAAIGLTDTWEATQADSWKEEELARLQDSWKNQEFATAMICSLEGERVFGEVSSEQIRRSNQDAIDALFGLSKFIGGEDAEKPRWERFLEVLPGGESVVRLLKEQIYYRVWRFAWSHQDQRRYLEKMQLLLQIARDAARQKSNVAAMRALQEYDEAIANRNFYETLRYPASTQSLATLSRVVKRSMQAETGRSLALCAIALKRYSIRHGQPPPNLAALIPEFLTEVPVDYMDGQPVKYRLNDDGSFTLYSVGEDGRDNGGDASLPPNKTNIRNLWDRKDYVWPAPALPEEIETYRKESSEP